MGSACFNVYSAKDVSLRLGETKTVDLDLGFQFSKKYVCRLYSGSSLSLKPLLLGVGVIDSDSRGNISVILINLFSWSVDIEKGDRIAQIMFVRKKKLKLRRSMNLTIRQRYKRFWFSWPKNCILLAVVKEMAENKKFEQMSKEEKDNWLMELSRGNCYLQKPLDLPLVMGH